MSDDADAWKDCTWEGTERRQTRLGLSLTHAERLRWLEESLEWIHRAHARTRAAVVAGPVAPKDREDG